jgi:serine/threonine-protein kinase RsbW
MSGLHSIRLPARLESMAEVRFFLKRVLDGWGLRAGLVHRLELAVEEVLVNISRYAYPGRDGDVEIRCCRSGEGELILEIHDWGITYNPLERDRPDPTQDLASRRVGGWGVELVRRMADDLQYSHAQGKNILSLTFRSRQTDQR